METWTERHNRIAKARKAQARAAGNRGGTWSDQVRSTSRIQRKRIRSVQGNGNWASQARKAARSRKQKIKNVQGDSPQLDDRARRGNRSKIRSSGTTSSWHTRLRKRI